MARKHRPASKAVRLARWLESRPCNRDGADKTWVVRSLRQVERIFRLARRVR